jgi:5'-nucleotidase
MVHTLSDKLVIAIASSALFDARQPHQIFEDQGEDIYSDYQWDRRDEPLPKGVAFSFIRRLLSLSTDINCPKVEVMILSKNDAYAGARVLNSCRHYGLSISRAAFTSGDPSTFRYAPALEACLFLSANEKDVKEAIMAGLPAGLVLETKYEDDSEDNQLRVAFDFDGVVASNEAEVVYRQTKSLERYFESETAKANEPLRRGLLNELLTKLAAIQKADRERRKGNKEAVPAIKIAIITARNAPADQRMINSLRSWGIMVDQTFLLGGIEKQKILKVFRPHIFFDDQRDNLDPSADFVPSVHVPFDSSGQG